MSIHFLMFTIKLKAKHIYIFFLEMLTIELNSFQFIQQDTHRMERWKCFLFFVLRETNKKTEVFTKDDIESEI